MCVAPVERKILQVRMYDLKELLEKAYSNEFTTESMSKATGIPVELIERYYNGADIDKTELQLLGQLVNFLMELYRDDIAQDEYIRGIIQALNYFFGLSNKTIANYLNISITELENLLHNPYGNEKYCRYSIKIMHLFMSFVRDWKDSCEQDYVEHMEPSCL